MPELIQNGGFEDEGYWEFYPDGLSKRDGSAARTGSWGGLLYAKEERLLPPFPIIPGWDATFRGAITVGQNLPVLFTGWGKVLTGVAELSISLWSQDGEDFLYQGQPTNTDWEMFSGLLITTRPAEFFQVRLAGGTTRLGRIRLFGMDDLSLEVVMPGTLRGAYVALWDRLKTVTVANGYHNTLTAVVPGLILPTQPGAPVLPYACIPLDDTGSYDHEDELVKAKLRQDIIVFAEYSEAISQADCAASKALYLHDDILKCLWPTSGPWWRLETSGVEDVEFVAKNIGPVMVDDSQFLEIAITADVTVQFQRNQI